MPALDELIGTVIADRYLVRKSIGQGGIGAVFKVTDDRMDRLSALKVLLPRFSTNPHFVTLLEHEAKITAKLQHPNIVNVYDRGQFDGLSYMVTAYVEGCSLKDILSKRAPLSLDNAMAIVVAVASALAYAHRNGVVHRDIKPSNILISREGQVFLTDFGLATAGGRPAVGEPGVIMGTRAYMSPEQAFGRDVDHRSDMYSLGIVVYECLTGTRPFSRETSSVRVTAAMEWVAVPPTSLNAAVPLAVEAVVLKALNENREERFAAIHDFVGALVDAAGACSNDNLSSLVCEADESARSGNTGVFAAEKVPLEGPVPAVYSLRVGTDGMVDDSAELAPKVETLVPAERALWMLLIHTQDGKTRALQLDSDRYTLGRSSANELCYSDDAGLSRQHLVIERSGDTWTVRDLNSKNGTLVNGERITTAFTLGLHDRITAGHLVMEFTVNKAPAANMAVFIDENSDNEGSSSVISNLKLSQNEVGIEGGAQMRALLRAGRELAGNMPLAELFNLIMTLSIDAVGAARGVLMTVEGKDLVVQAARGEGFRISSMVRDRVIREKTSLLVCDARLDEAFAGRESIVQQQIRSMLAVPLQTDDRVIGLIYLDSPHLVHEFTKDDLNLLTVMANVAAIRIEHTRLAEVEQAERALARDLQQAAVIQQGLLPTGAPEVPGVDLAGYNAACSTVAGDYYDFISYSDGRVAIVLGDVAGKGMPAALLMSSLQARVQVLFDDPTDLAALVTRLNRIIATNCPANRFVTFFVGVVNPRTDEMTYCNAGCLPPLLVHRDGRVERLESTGIVLGILPVAPFRQETCRLEVGDVVALFSDGVAERVNQNEEEFGEERVIEVVMKTRNAGAEQIVRAIVDSNEEFARGFPPSDDVTVVVLRRVPI